MDLKALEKQFHAEGFRRTYVWQDAPGVYNPEHTHPTETAHIILEGEMTLTTGGKTKAFRAGERGRVYPERRPARRAGRSRRIHSAKMGPAGCRYLIGEK